MTARVIASAAGSANPTTSFTITIPAACAAGDDLYVLATSRGHTSGTAKATISDNDTGGNSWTEVTSSTSRQLMLWHKKATSGTASKTITVSGCVDSSPVASRCFVRGASSGDPTTNISLQSNISGAESHTGFTPTTTTASSAWASATPRTTMTFPRRRRPTPRRFTEKLRSSVDGRQ
jgi:hypothetical protein